MFLVAESCICLHLKHQRVLLEISGTVNMAIVWDDLHYNTNETRTHNCDVNILLSGREAGKSTAVLKMLLDNYEKNGSRFIWLLRQKSQLNKEFYDSFL